MTLKIAEIIKSVDAPTRMASRDQRYIYPWDDLAPGDCFRFSDAIKPSSARVLASHKSRELNMKFVAYRSTDDRMYCRRMDGLSGADREPPAQPGYLPAPRFGPEAMPAVAEAYLPVVSADAGHDVMLFPGDPRPAWQQLEYPSEEAWRADGARMPPIDPDTPI